MTQLLEEINSFNEEQLAAIFAGRGVYKVLAGPGSGKTAVLVARYLKLKAEGHYPICLTFTRAAAKEMKERAGGGNFRTIHSLAYKIIQDNAENTAGFIAPPLEELVKFATEILFEKLRHGKFLYSYVMVDEAQDCSAEDWDFISLLSENLFAVGDAMQCLYGFRNSKPELFLKMEDMFPNTQTLLLGKNYRSTKAIVDFCKSIAPIRGALLEKLCTENEQGDPVVIASFQHNVEEAEFVIARERELEQNGERDSVVLARTNKQLELFIKLNAPERLELRTIHAAKGNEWNNVFVIGTQQGLIPFKDGDLDEEGRILFVAASRAKKRLTLTRYGTPSRFIVGPGRSL